MTTILYVDDESINLQVFEAIFQKEFKVITADSGISGLALLRDNSTINIVISDMKMPLMNGIDFITKAREIMPDSSFFILTGYDITNELRDALNTKLIHKCFRKPINVPEIKTAINETLLNE